MTLQTDLETAVADAQAASQKLKDVVNGPATGAGSTVAVDSGPVKTVARAIAEVGDTSNQALKDLSNVVDGDFTAKAVAAGVAGDVIAAGNLADLTDAAAARSNLGLGAAAVEAVSVGGAGGLLRADGDGSGLTGIVTGANAAEKANIMLNAFRISVNGGLSIQQMADGVVDEYEDETGVSPSYVQIPQSDGTPIGNMTAGGGLAAGFDGNLNQNRGASAATAAAAPATLTTCIGKDWGPGVTKTVAKVVITAPNTTVGIQGGGGSGNYELQGSTDNFSTSVVTLATGAFAGGIASEVVTSEGGDVTTTTAYGYHRVATDGDGVNDNAIAEVVFYEAGDTVNETYNAANDYFSNGAGSAHPAGTEVTHLAAAPIVAINGSAAVVYTGAGYALSKMRNDDLQQIMGHITSGVNDGYGPQFPHDITFDAFDFRTNNSTSYLTGFKVQVRQGTTWVDANVTSIDAGGSGAGTACTATAGDQWVECNLTPITGNAIAVYQTGYSGGNGNSGIDEMKVWGAYTGPDAGTHTVEQTSHDANATYGVEWSTSIAQSFKIADATRKVSRAYVKAKYTVAGAWTITLQTDNAGAPSGTLVGAGATISGTPFSGAAEWDEWVFATPQSLLADTTYWLVITRNTGTQQVRINSAGGYADGGLAYDGVVQAGKDMAFKIFQDGDATPKNMTLTSIAQTALAVPTDCFVTIWQEDVDSITLNTDLTAEVSRDGGATWTSITLAEEATLDTGRILTGAADISGQPSGTSMRYRIQTLNTKEQRIHGVALQWS